MRKLILFLTASVCLAQTTNYPSAVDNDASLFVLADNVQSTLSTAMAIGDTVAVVASPTGFAVNMIATICDTITSTGKCTAFEHMKITGVAGNVLTVTRGFAGTSARAHSSGKLISIVWNASNQKVLKDAVVAIETALGPSLSNVPTYPYLKSSTYNFTPQSPGGSLVIGNNSITMTPVPLGVNGTNTDHYLYVSGGVGTAEACLITGGAGTSGQSSGAVIINCANTHSGAWTIQSATAGITEAIWTLATTGGQIDVPPGNQTVYGTITLGNGTSSANSTRNHIALVGGGGWGYTTASAGASRLVWAGASGGTMIHIAGPVQGVQIRDLYLDGNAVAATGIMSDHMMQSSVARVGVANFTSKGIDLSAYDMAGITSAGAGPNTFDMIDIAMAGLNSKALIVGQAAYNTNSFDVARNYFRDIDILGNSLNTGSAIELRFADSCDFANVSVQGWASGFHLKFTAPAPGNVNFPSGNTFRNMFINPSLIAYDTFTVAGVTAGATTTVNIVGHKFSIANEFGYFQGGTGNWAKFNGLHQIVSIVDANNVIVNWNSTGYGAMAGTITGTYGNYVNQFDNLQREDGVPDTILWPTGAGFKGCDNYRNCHYYNRLGVGTKASSTYLLDMVPNFGGDAADRLSSASGNVYRDMQIVGGTGLRQKVTSAGTASLESIGVDTVLSGGLASGAAFMWNRVVGNLAGGTVASAGTITASAQQFTVSGAATISTINAASGFTAGCINIIPAAGSTWVTDTAGNIGKASTAVVGKVLTECFDPATNKWFPSY